MTGAGLTSWNDEAPWPRCRSGAARPAAGFRQPAGASRPQAGAATARAPASACLALPSASRRVSTCRSGIPARQQTSSTMSGIFIQNQLIISPSPASMAAPVETGVPTRP
jgi:hypothetical protein